MSKPQALLTDTAAKQVATLAVAGRSIREIAEELNITKRQVNKLMATPEFKAVCKDIGDTALASAKEHIRSKLGGLATEVTRVITERLKDNDLEAVKIVMKTYGFDQVQEPTKDTTLNVFLPGSTQDKPQEIEVPNQIIEVSDGE